VLRPFLNIVTGLAIFVVVGAAVSGVMIRRRSSSVELAYRLPEEHIARGDEAVRILRERAEALAGELGVLRWEVDRDGGIITVRATARGGLDVFTELLTRRGLISFHEAALAAGPKGELPCPEGFREASFTDYIYRTKGEFGEKMERRTDLYVRETSSTSPTPDASARYRAA